MARTKVPLKNGAGRLELVTVRAAQEDLGLLARDDPDAFAALRAMTEGRGEQVGPRERQALKEWGLLSKNGTVLDEYQAVFRASHRETVAGALIEEPIDVSVPGIADIVDRFEELERAEIERDRRREALRRQELESEVRKQSGKDEPGRGR